LEEVMEAVLIAIRNGRGAPPRRHWTASTASVRGFATFRLAAFALKAILLVACALAAMH
jgi:hypothetical protein